MPEDTTPACYELSAMERETMTEAVARLAHLEALLAEALRAQQAVVNLVVDRSGIPGGVLNLQAMAVIAPV